MHIVTQSVIVSTIRLMLGTDSTASRDAIVSRVADELGVEGERVGFAIDCMLEDGGLRRNARGWLYVVLPHDDAEPYDPPARRPSEVST